MPPTHADIGTLAAELPLVTVLPFVLLLLAIALAPLVAGHWWNEHRNKAIVVTFLALPVAIYLHAAWGVAGRAVLEEKVLEYISFIVLLAALFVISGGIYLEGSLAGTPLVNTGMMGLGAVLANVIGTTGASVLLIRPLLRANHSRRRTAHIIVFFIFIVANCGGLLTPLGDPPLFLGYLKGVPFEWTLRLWPQWLAVNVVLLAIFNVWDQWALNREERARRGSQLEQAMRHEPFRIHGALNVVWLVGIILTIYAAGGGMGAGSEPWPFGCKEALMAAMAVAAYALTPRVNRDNNQFTFG
ncbi:MAG: sodium:proton antiporter, partial [Burkholderiales bacterium]